MSIFLACALAVVGLAGILPSLQPALNRMPGAGFLLILQAALMVTVLVVSLYGYINSYQEIGVLTVCAVWAAACGGSLPLATLLNRIANRESELSTGSDDSKQLHGSITTPEGEQLQIEGTLSSPKTHESALLAGGHWIGIFERLTIAALLVFAQPALLAAVVAVKGLARYPEIRAKSSLAEKFIVGTFASALWAGLCVLPTHLIQMG
ncbi:hypothetical protein [Rothia nasimurium]|uniref:hypothetical protein n=1 Tax=Rothia nasimurium TaxID=85336 RepID=UPI002DD69C54|nr:hypothetical protein [Rothia nasimurium]